MRLIDADKIMKRLEAWNTNDPMDQALYRFALSRILEAPTVDAIPIEWIKRWVNSHSTYCYDYDYPEDEYDGWYVIRTMIEDWEKEND